MIDGLSAGALLRAARVRAGLSQSELARRADVAQSVVSVYESGRRQPSLPKLAALIEATGCALDIRIAEGTPDSTQGLAERIRLHAEEVKSVASSYGVLVLGIFGSVARGDGRPDSDIDLLVDVPPGVGLFSLGRLEEELRQLLGAEIDLVPVAGLKPRVAESITSDLVAL